MRLVRVESSGTFQSFLTVCKECGKRVWSSDGLFADLEGEAFQDYYCESCAILIAPLKAALKDAAGTVEAKEIQKRLEYLRGEIENECISYGEIIELQALAEYIDSSDTVLLEWAGVPEGAAVAKYAVLLQHDEGSIQITTTASSQEAAIDKALKAENAPPSAVINVVRLD